MTERDLEEMTISEVAPRIRTGDISPVELTHLFLDRIHRLNPILNAYITVTGEQALAESTIAEKEIQRGQYRGPLHGIPFSIKDNLATKGVRTTAGSKILSDWLPDQDATVVTKLKEAGAIILGKTNLHEWALGGTTINPYYGTTHNPWDLKRIAGGSSGGSGAAVAASLCLGSLGTDSAQSVRNPASMCGIVGLKPTYGRVSQFGGVVGTGAFSTNHVGVLSKTVEDCALVLEAVAGHDAMDPLSADEPVPQYSQTIGKEVKGLRVGILRGYFEDVLAREVKMSMSNAVEVLKSLGMNEEEVSIPHMDLIPAVKLATSRIENVSAHEPHLRTRPRDYSPQTLYSYICALLMPAATYVTAQRVRRLIDEEFDELLKRVQVLVVPTVPFPVPTIEKCQQGFVEVDKKRLKRQDPRGPIDTLSTIPFNVTGLPALSVPCGFSESGHPIGMQIASGPFQEGIAFQVAHAYERSARWYTRRPHLP